MPTLERETELDCIAEALDGAAGGSGRVVVIEGPAGIGKTRLVADARALAKLRGFGRLWAVGDELESAMPWAVVRQLVDRAVSRYRGVTRDAILAGPAGVALEALDRAPDEAGGAGDAALARTLHALWWVAADLAADRPLLICIDDAQWSDLPSLRFLVHLARRIEDLPIALVIATRPPGERSGPLAELTAGCVGRRLAPQPLSGAAIAELCTRDEVEPAPAVLAALHAASGGTPLLAGQLAEELDARGLELGDPQTATAIAGLGPSTISRALLARLPDEAVRLAAAAAVLGTHADARLAGELTRVDGAGLRRRSTRSSPGTCSTAPATSCASCTRSCARRCSRRSHPALRAAAAVALRAADAPKQRVAAHLAASPAGTLPDAATLLRDAATLLLADGDAATAARHLRRALAESPDDDAIAAQLGATLLRAREFEQARAVLRAAARGAFDARRARRPAGGRRLRDAGDRRAGAGDRGAARRARRVADGRRSLARRARARGPPGDAVLVHAEQMQRSGERLRELADLPGSDRAQRTLLALLAQHGMYAVRPASEVAALAKRALGDGAYAADGLIPWANAVGALIVADGVDLALAEVEHARRRLRGSASPVEFAAVSSVAATAAWRRGDVTGAEADAEAVVAALAYADAGATIAVLRAVGTRHLVLAALERDDVAVAGAALARFDGECPDAHELIAITRLREARAALALARDDPARAPRGVCARRAGPRRADRHASVPWRGPASIALQRLDEQDEARALAAEQLELAKRWGAASDVGAALRLNARVDPERRVELLERSIALLEAAPWRLELARVLTDYGNALRAVRRRLDAGEPLRRAEFADACGARALAALGDRPRKLCSPARSR